MKIRATCPEPSRRVRGKEFPSEVWGDGTAVRVFTYVDDLVDGIYTLMQSDLEGPVNIGGDERVTVADLVRTVIEVSGKRIKVK